MICRGGIVKNGATTADLTCASAQTFIFRLSEGVACVEAFQNTRTRPIDGPQTAAIWQEFDRAWFAEERRRQNSA